MKIKSKLALAICSVSAGLMSAPVSAEIYTYNMKANNGVLTIDTEAKTGSWVADDLNVTFASDDFANFKGGEYIGTYRHAGGDEYFEATLSNGSETTLEGYRIVDGKKYAPFNRYLEGHPHKIIFGHQDGLILWSWWGDRQQYGDYYGLPKGYSAKPSSTGSTGGSSGTEVPEPAMVGMFGLGVLGLMFARRRYRIAKRSKVQLALA